MSTSAPLPIPTPIPAPKSSVTISNILMILQIALGALSTIPGVGTDIAIAGAFVKIIQNAMTAYHAAAGQPLDLTKLPMESLVP